MMCMYFKALVFCLQFLIRGYDTFYPNNWASCTVHITVIRNPNSPLYTQSSYEKTINEYHQVGSTVLAVSAQDQDGVSL